MSRFALLPITVCIYEIVSLILPLKISAWAKVFCALILISGLAKIFAIVRTATGFDLYEMPYVVNLAVSLIFNFVIVAFFMLLIKDLIFIAWRFILRFQFPLHNASLFVFSIALCATLYGTYQGLKVPDVKIHEVFIENLGKDFDGMKIAMLVDIHADNLTDKDIVKGIVDKTNSLDPDLILIPGDFVDGQVKNRSADLRPIENLKARYGVYGVTGNHEYYFDYEGWIKEIKKFGVKLLENENVIITSGDSKIILVGVPDITGAHMGLVAPDINLALKNVPENLPIILMDHRPEFARENSKHNVTLQVSGHTHGGQMPIIDFLVRRANKGFVRGWYEIEGMKLYVSPGTSQWNGFSLRLFDPSEITLFILRKK